MWKPLCAAALALWMSACAGTPHYLTVEHISDREVHVVQLAAPEFEFSPPVGVLRRHGHHSSGFIMNTPPSQVTVSESGKPPVVVRVPPLPPGAGGDITLHVIYRSPTMGTHCSISSAVPGSPSATIGCSRSSRREVPSPVVVHSR